MSVAAVLGGASGNLDELAALRAMVNVDAVFAVNDAAAEYAGDDLAAFVTLHFEKLPTWLEKRRSLGLTAPREVIGHEQQPLVTRVVDYRWPGMNASGSSGLFAVKVALEQYDRVVLCGVPMDATRGHYFTDQPWHEVNGFFSGWEIALEFIKDRVRSMSGWTAEKLGRPDFEFLHPAGGIPVLNSGML